MNNLLLSILVWWIQYYLKEIQTCMNWDMVLFIHSPPDLICWDDIEKNSSWYVQYIYFAWYRIVVQGLPCTVHTVKYTSLELGRLRDEWWYHPFEVFHDLRPSVHNAGWVSWKLSWFSLGHLNHPWRKMIRHCEHSAVPAPVYVPAGTRIL